jgi:NAD(P)-dependent dehydrogenase (short-subunit alcohol dehydrogenase family)
MMTAAATPEHFEKIFSTNARGTYFTVQKALRAQRITVSRASGIPFTV